MSQPIESSGQPLGTTRPARETRGFINAENNDVTIEKRRFIELIEVELWGKFQKRLWATITGFLVLVSVAGLLGIPFYIEGQTSAIFSTQSKKYEEEVRRITSYLKSYLLLSSKFEAFHQRLRQDIYVVLQDLAENEDTHPQVRSLFRPDEMFLKVLHEDDPRDLINQRGILFPHHIRGEFDGIRISINETIHLENTIFGATGSTSAPHPYRNGTLKGFVEDVKMKILILAAFKDALDAQQEVIFQIGGETNLEKRTRGLEVEAISNSEFLPNFDKYLSNNSGKLEFSQNGFADPKEVFKFYIEILNFDPAKIPSIGELKIDVNRGDDG